MGPFMKREFYSDSIDALLDAKQDEIFGSLARNNTFALDPSQRDAWEKEIEIVRTGVALIAARARSISSTRFHDWVGESTFLP